jgi:hypothetical protein
MRIGLVARSTGIIMVALLAIALILQVAIVAAEVVGRTRNLIRALSA